MSTTLLANMTIHPGVTTKCQFVLLRTSHWPDRRICLGIEENRYERALSSGRQTKWIFVSRKFEISNSNSFFSLRHFSFLVDNLPSTFLGYDVHNNRIGTTLATFASLKFLFINLHIERILVCLTTKALLFLSLQFKLLSLDHNFTQDFSTVWFNLSNWNPILLVIVVSNIYSFILVITIMMLHSRILQHIHVLFIIHNTIFITISGFNEVNYVKSSQLRNLQPPQSTINLGWIQHTGIIKIKGCKTLPESQLSSV
mmetsp:Transcript_35739/g.66731  ORF Transcript_35739/g.66731 Transcript_35739/m.66731 type:complete len:256 (+) Transcript_35739:1281-2048(+)